MTAKILTPRQKLAQLSPELRDMIILQEDRDKVNAKHRHVFEKLLKNPSSLMSYCSETMLHCNAGATIDTARWLQAHLAQGGKLVITLAGALSTFEIGKLLAPLIRAGKVHLVSATGANHEESYYRYVAHSYYAYIPRYTELTPAQEAELRDAGYRRITSTFLPEEESVRKIDPIMKKTVLVAGKSLRPVKTKLGYVLEGSRKFPHEFFQSVFKDYNIADPKARPDDCWALAALKKDIPIVIPGFEDSTWGNIFAGYTFKGMLGNKGYVPELNMFAMKTGVEYMHFLYKWYMENSKKVPVAFLQLGGGISADFPICVVPSLKDDMQLHENVRDWAGFVEINTVPMSQGSYTGAGGKEKITWCKLAVNSYYNIVQNDVTLAFPVIAAALLCDKKI